LYAYVSGQVLRNVDPLGLEATASVADENGNPAVINDDGTVENKTTEAAQTEIVRAEAKEAAQRVPGAAAPPGANPFLPLDRQDIPAPAKRMTLDEAQLGLDVTSVGLELSVVGAPFSWAPDAVNACISLCRGDYVGAGMSVGAMAPGLGIGANLARMGRHADEAAGVSQQSVDLYRAVGVREFESVMSSQKFLPGGNSLEGRQFAHTLDEALAFADTDVSKVAIVKVTIKGDALPMLDFSKNIDPHIFKNGVITVQPGMQSDVFHQSMIGLKHEF